MSSQLRLGRCLLASRALGRHAARPLACRATPARSLWNLPSSQRRLEAETPWRGVRGSVGVRASAGTSGEALADSPAEAPKQLLSFFVTCGPGLEPVVAAELLSPRIGAVDVQEGSAGVSFRGSRATGYRANLWLRSAVRVLVRLASADLKIDPYSKGRRGGDAVYDFVKRAAPWDEVIPKGRTFSVDSRIRDCTDIRSSQMAGTVAKDAICDALRDARGDKPDPPESTADVPLFLSLYRDKAVLYRDMSGESLHKRGYREGLPIHKGALNESAAAGILSLSGWLGAPEGLETVAPRAVLGGARSPVLVDPMCGSGTFLIEGALMAGQVAPGLLRSRWPFENWPDHSKKIWASCLEEAKEVARSAEAKHALESVAIHGADIHAGALGLAEQAAQAAGVRRHVKLKRSDVRELSLEGLPPVTHVVTNPPWGLRLQGPDEMPESELFETWFQLGCFLRKKCGGAEASMLTGNPDPAAKLFLKGGRRVPLRVGGIDCRMLHFSILDAEKRSETDSWRGEKRSPARAGGGAGKRGSERAGAGGGEAGAGSGMWADLSEGAADRWADSDAGGRGAGEGTSSQATAAEEQHPLSRRGVRAAGAATTSAADAQQGSPAVVSGGAPSPFAPEDAEGEGAGAAAPKRRRAAAVVVAPPPAAGGSAPRPRGARWGGLK